MQPEIPVCIRIYYRKEQINMKHIRKAKISAVLIAAAIAAGAATMPASAKYNLSTTTQGTAFMPAAQTYWKYGEMNKYLAGFYWNCGLPEQCSWRPCEDHSTTSMCNSYPAGIEVRDKYESYTPYPYHMKGQKYWQCAGFARMLASDFFGFNGDKIDNTQDDGVWMNIPYKNGFQFRFGDQLRVKNSSHVIFVTGVNGNTLTFADCNADNHCRIRWDVSATITKSYGSDGQIHAYLKFRDENGQNQRWSIDSIQRPVMAGDIDGDCRITMTDVDSIWAIYAGYFDTNGKDMTIIREAADLNNDNQVTFADYYIAYTQYDGSGYFGSQRFITCLTD